MLPSLRRGGPGCGPLPVAHASLLMEGVKSASEETRVAIRGVKMDICRPLEGESQAGDATEGSGVPPPLIPIL